MTGDLLVSRPPTIGESILAEMAASKEPQEPNVGFVAFLDMLGFGELNLQYDIQTVRSIIQDVLHPTAKEISNDFAPVGALDSSFAIVRFFFADSILLFNDMRDSPSANLAKQTFVDFCRVLIGRLLARGIPVRGAIAHGEYFIIGAACFVGKPLIEAHRLGESLQLCGCALAPSAELALSKNEITTQSVMEYETPVKGAGKLRLRMLNYLEAMEQERKAAPSRHLVFRAFSTHGQFISCEVLPKVLNTIAFLDHCKSPS